MGRPPGSANNRRIQMVGEKYGDWTVLEEVNKKSKERRFLCECICGKRTEVDMNNLRSGHVRNCGCTRLGNYRHGFAKKDHRGFSHPMYASWNQMMQRCYNERNPTYQFYGARGIKVVDYWHTFTGFLAYMEDSYEDGLILGRIDHSKDYTPDNCKWVTLEESRSDRYRS